MSNSTVTVCYLVASVLFILSLGGLASQETARRGNLFGILGMVIAVLATTLNMAPDAFPLLLAVISVGAIVGSLVAARVAMTSMPELVAILHSFVGLAAVLIGIGAHLSSDHSLGETESLIHSVEIFIGVFVGAVTLTGSIIAFGKLRGKISGKPLLLPGRHMLNLGAIGVSLVLAFFFVSQAPDGGLWALLLMTVIAMVVGAHLVMAIGGADMPVVVSMLNSYSGWAAAATGFMLANDLLIITGALVGSSGAILSYIMCNAMNRSFLSVILGGFGTSEGAVSTAAPGGETVEVKADEVAEMLLAARQVIVVPGYGMAVAQAQHPLREIMERLKARGVTVRFAIHPVAGRLPGHMNVLLAEANVPYDLVLEMEEINEDFPSTDVVLVIGANDIVNPGAMEDPGSPIYGMPVLEAWHARSVVVFKRSMASGYSGADNPLFYKENTRMLFGDAKKSVLGILGSLPER